MKLKNIKEIRNIRGKKVFVRVDFNVPLVDGKIRDANRIEKTLPTINFLKNKGARIVLGSHIGSDGEESLGAVAKYLNKFVNVKFLKYTSPIEAKDEIEKMKNGEIILLENLRKDKREIANNKSFAKDNMKMFDAYVNEAFPVSHRLHASVANFPKFVPAYMGNQYAKEITNLSKAFKPKRPFLVIFGGAKFDTKIPLIKKFIRIADYVFVAGALSNEFFEEMGMKVGKSVVDHRDFKLRTLAKKEKLLLPCDLTLFDGKNKRYGVPEEINENEMIVDIGPVTLDALKKIIRKSKMVLWNGPTGLYEKGFDEMSKQILKTLAESKTYSIVGGGDTEVLISRMKIKGKPIEDKLGFVSTGGGATLHFLINGV